MSLVKTLNQLIEPAVEAVGYEFVGLEYVTQRPHSVLRVYIDSDDGIQVDDCAKVSRQVSAVLDVEDPITGQYNLEVSSPGLDRPLFKQAHFVQCIGQNVSVRLATGMNGRRHFKGILKQVDAQNITLECDDDQSFVLDFEKIDKANVIPDFDNLD